MHFNMAYHVNKEQKPISNLMGKKNYCCKAAFQEQLKVPARTAIGEQLNELLLESS